MAHRGVVSQRPLHEHPHLGGTHRRPGHDFVTPWARLRRQAGSVIAHGFFAGLSSAARLHPKANPERHRIEVIRDVPYQSTGEVAHRLDVYRRRDLDPSTRPTGQLAPVVLYLHGGGFRILSKDTHWLMGLAFARKGYVVFNASYRLAPRFPFPAAFEDAAGALRWVLDNAERYGGDPGRVVLAGESAGGNLVTSLALATSYETLRGAGAGVARQLFDTGFRAESVVAACGLLQVSDPERFVRRWPRMPAFVADRVAEASEAYLGRDVGEVGRHDLADPLVCLERGERPARPLPPIFAPCGTKDPLIDDAQRLDVALRALGVPCEVPIYPGEIHAFHALLWRPEARRCWRDTFAFLERHAPLRA